jgi:hypothetical protein
MQAASRFYGSGSIGVTRPNRRKVRSFSDNPVAFFVALPVSPIEFTGKFEGDSDVVVSLCSGGPMTPRLVSISSPYTGKIWPVSDAGLKVGRAADNDVYLPDELVSRHHFHIEFGDGGFWLCDEDTPNGTWVFDRACAKKRLQHGDRIKCGSAAFLYLELESSDNDLTAIAKAETRRVYQYPTPRADHSGHTDVAVARDGALKVLFEMGRALHAIEDSAELQARLLDLSFEMIPAFRGAILLNGPRIGPDLDTRSQPPRRTSHGRRQLRRHCRHVAGQRAFRCRERRVHGRRRQAGETAPRG